MADSQVTTPKSAHAPATQPHVTGATGLGELGRTTSPQGWLALVALLLVIIGFVVWGLFGTIPVQSTIPATVTNGAYPLQITAGVQGTVATILKPVPGQGLIAAGTELMTIKPSKGGPNVSVKAPVQMGIAMEVIQGSPVEPQTVVANGSPVASSDSSTGKAEVYAFLSFDVVQTLQSAEKLTVTPNSPELSSTAAPIEITVVGTVPESQAHIAEITGNTIYAEQAYSDAGGAPYAVIFAYTNAADADQVKGTSAAQITVTQATPHPLDLLFSQ